MSHLTVIGLLSCKSLNALFPGAYSECSKYCVVIFETKAAEMSHLKRNNSPPWVLHTHKMSHFKVFFCCCCCAIKIAKGQRIYTGDLSN